MVIVTYTGNAMNPTREKKVKAYFQTHKVSDLEHLYRIIGTATRMTVFRCLHEIGYLTSCSHAGRYYTLLNIPVFDTNGLWRWQDILFSSHGTLRKCLQHLVESAPAGVSHDELQNILGIPVQQSLRHLIQEDLIVREKIGRAFVYLSTVKDKSELQASERKSRILGEAISGIKSDVLIAIMLQLLRSKDWRPDVIAKAANRENKSVSAEQVRYVMDYYSLKKNSRDD